MVSLSSKAIEDIEGIINHTFKSFGYDAMLDYHQSLEGCLEILSKNSNIGLNYDHVGLGYRCFYHRSHAIFYKNKSKGVFVIRILHKSMDVQKHFD
ncbi:MAG: type II toxin-antitoxin system RelE/ParE family toxin [Candidatus Thioglobus sp.]|jgi:toxin ParE1/3/4|nr:type II toxin-antitoxin system RelE/ParE family toxin [Candidatus Thioglobus sp.]